MCALAGMFKCYCAFLSLLKFDAMLSVLVLLMMNFLSVSIDSSNLPLGIVTLVVSVAWCAISHYISAISLQPFPTSSILSTSVCQLTSTSNPASWTTIASATRVLGVISTAKYEVYKCRNNMKKALGTGE